MTLVDTNIVSELLRPEPDLGVTTWLHARALDEMSIAPVSVAELLVGLALMLEGRRRSGLQAETDGTLTEFHGLTVATRDTAPFAATGIPVINPWQPAA